ncbi:DUF4342 domain-containing protein [Lutispora saccharofermentans]|uniref:DUF4342 domain-containing protein n=1 Tax=Lutispora saccharofermentans TaxID=3024236 RepID=A0ABT1NHU7_9FIRM|nr:DUF4342 domain-containing protein [Lutispora saccharofermentans]MCQ1530847.1 DUF4342 domain-containing protein [Lutispora saccharofermentans]
MDITLDKIDIIRDRTGVSYKEAREALTQADGNVVDALISIEESSGRNWTESVSVKGSEVIDKLKTVVKSGNVNRIRVKKDDSVILDIPVTAGAISAVVMPQITALGTAAALLTKCTIEVERQNKDTVNVNSVINDAIVNAADKVKDFAEDVKNTTQNMTNSNTGEDCCPKIDTDLP